jgi:glycosyltransferase involved in cell wall biosynthesis
MGYDVRILPLSWWLYVDASWWYFKNLVGGAWRRITLLARIIRTEHVDLVYSNTAAVFEGAIAARLAGKPHVWHVHEVLERQSRLRSLAPISWIKRLIRRYSSTVIFESRASMCVFTSSTPLPRGAVIHNPLRFSSDEPEVTQSDARHRLGLPVHAWIVAYVGQFIDRKDPLTLIDAFARLADCDDAMLLMAGDGPLRAAVEARIASLGLQSRCKVLPFQKDVRTVYSAIDVLALPSKYESFGLVLIEAAACGKPVVAMRSQGPEEIVIDGVTGLLTPPGDWGALADALRRLHGSPQEYRRMASAAKAHVAEFFDPKAYAAAVANEFERTLDVVERGAKSPTGDRA